MKLLLLTSLTQTDKSLVYLKGLRLASITAPGTDSLDVLENFNVLNTSLSYL